MITVYPGGGGVEGGGAFVPLAIISPTHPPPYTQGFTRYCIRVFWYIISDSQDTFVRAKSWVKELQRQASPNIVIALSGNKADLAGKRMVDFEVSYMYVYKGNSVLCFYRSKVMLCTAYGINHMHVLCCMYTYNVYTSALW